MATTNGRTRNWCFTYYNMVSFSSSFLKNFDTKVKYMIMGSEICPETNKEHIQGFFQMDNAIRNGKKFLMDNGFDKTVHIEPCNGSPFQNFQYCSKDGDYLEIGARPKGQGAREDIKKIKKLVKEGGGMKEICEVSTSYQSMKCGELLLKYCETPRDVSPIEVIWYYGKSGTGKTKSIFDTEVNIFRPTSYKWWEGYDNHSVVLVDDWRPSWCSFVNLLKLTDIYPFRVQTKGGSRQVKYNKIYFTSHLSPEEYFSELEETDYQQLKRRITKLKQFE